MLKLTDLHKELGGRAILKGVDLVCDAGAPTMILGANGSGKSTLLRVVCGLIEPSRGQVHVLGRDLRRDPVGVKAQLGYVPDGLNALPDLLVSEFVALVVALKSAALHERAEPEPELKQRLGVDVLWRQRLVNLSFGQRKRVALLAALCGSPWLLVLDEPSNGLDPGGLELMLQLIAERRERGQATLLTTNDLAFCDRFPSRRYWLEGGRLRPEIADQSGA